MPKKHRLPKIKIPTREFLRKYGLPAFLIPGIILAATMGFNWEKLIATDPRRNPNIFATNAPVAEVQDGDTIRLTRGLPIRLIGMDAPDKGQPYYNEARAYLVELVDDRQVRIEYDRVQNDNYGRLRGWAFVPCKTPPPSACQNGEINLNIAIVQAGLARVNLGKLWAKPKYAPQLRQAESTAKANSLGLWSADNR